MLTKQEYRKQFTDYLSHCTTRTRTLMQVP